MKKKLIKITEEIINDDAQDTPELQPNAEQKPEVYKIASVNRREFMTDAAKTFVGLAGISLLTQLLTSCEKQEIRIENDGENCTCHVVCNCDTEGASKKSTKQGQWENNTCTCNTVCTCDTVCTCNSEGGGGGGGYSYYYYYPN